MSFVISASCSSLFVNAWHQQRVFWRKGTANTTLYVPCLSKNVLSYARKMTSDLILTLRLQKALSFPYCHCLLCRSTSITVWAEWRSFVTVRRSDRESPTSGSWEVFMTLVGEWQTTPTLSSLSTTTITSVGTAVVDRSWPTRSPSSTGWPWPLPLPGTMALPGTWRLLLYQIGDNYGFMTYMRTSTHTMLQQNENCFLKKHSNPPE